MNRNDVIMVVEDDPTLQLVMGMCLKELGYRCITIGSGEEAVQRAQSDIALIFMDIGLPGIQGVHATMLIREKELREGRKRVPIVAVTGHSNMAECITAGMDDFLQKPALLADLRRLIAKWAPELKAGERGSIDLPKQGR